MGFVLRKRFSGGKLIYQSFSKKLLSTEVVPAACSALRLCACGKLFSSLLLF